MSKMSVEEFESWAGKVVRKYLPGRFDKSDPVFDVFTKHSLSYNGMFIRPEGETISSVVNMDDFYSRYLDGEPLDLLASDMSKVITVTPPKMEDMVSRILDYKKVKRNLFIRVCTRETAGDRFRNCPTQSFDEFVITYNIRLRYAPDCFGAVLIDNEMLDKYGVTAQQLHNDAVKSSSRMLPACYDSIEEIAGFWGRDDIPLPDCIREMLIISDKYSKAGSAVLFYPDLLEKIGEKLNGNYYLMPYSELCTIAFPEKYEDDLDEYLNFIKATYCPENDGNLMSRNVYMYDVVNSKLMCCKNAF